MKKINLIALAILSLSLSSYGQKFEWAKSFGAQFYDRSTSIIVDDSSNVYVSGYFQGTADFDPGTGATNLTSTGGNDIFVQKLDASGDFIWAKSFGGTENDLLAAMIIDASGNLYTTGYFRGTVDFDPGTSSENLSSAGDADFFVQKLDASGNFLWAKSFGGDDFDNGTSISLDTSGNVYTTGAFRKTVDFDPGAGITNLTSAGESDVFLQKLDPSGNFLWAKSFGGTGIDRASSLRIDSTGNLFTTGSFANSVDFDPGTGTQNITAIANSDVFVHKMDVFGNFIWAKSFGGINSGLSATSMDIDNTSNVYVSGSFDGTVDFDPGIGTTNLTSAGESDAYVLKIDASGNFLWAKSFGGSYIDRGFSLSIDPFGGVYTAGTFSNTVDFDLGPGIKNLTAIGGFDVFLLRLDPSGNFLWARSFGNESYTTARTAIDASGNLYSSGTFSGTVDFDPGTGTTTLSTDNSINLGNGDVFVQKLSYCEPIRSTDEITACSSYTWIDGNTYTTSNNTATFIFEEVSGEGCDSLVSLNLTINKVLDLSTSISGTTLSSNNSLATYQWLDCDNGYAIIAGEDGQSYTVEVNGNYSVELIENGCTDTTACVTVTPVSVIENSFGEKLDVFPNPTKGNFSIDLGESQDDVKIIIKDVNGRLVQSSKHNNTQFLNLNLNAPLGIYLLSIESEKNSAIIRLIKQ